ncbi:hypothetical protein DSBG_2862 [Desulfosporosinus sp. BG]|nr:hypothetical protein DSBG_2862 [Desulfosporosinus sp. BG]
MSNEGLKRVINSKAQGRVVSQVIFIVTKILSNGYRKEKREL